MYKRTDRETSYLFSELMPFGGELDEGNRWLKLAKLIPWDELEAAYAARFPSGTGRPAADARLVCGLLVVKHKLCVSDEEVVQCLLESPYVQAFCGLESFATRGVLDPSLLSKKRRQLGPEFFRKFEDEVLAALKARGLLKAGVQFVDATVVPADIAYPTDCGLIEKARRWAVGVIKASGEKVRTYCRKARGVFVNFRRKRRRNKRFIQKTRGQLLRFLRRNIAQLERLAERGYSVPREKLAVVKKLYAQQYDMWKNKLRTVPERLVSLDKPQVRAMVRGKDGRDVEFGPKVLLSNVDGYAFADHVAYESYNEALHAGKSIAEYERRFGKKPKAIVGDGIFGNRDNRQMLKDLTIRDAFKPLGRPGPEAKARRGWLRKMLNLRNGEMEGIIGLGKSKYGLDRMRYRVPGCEEIWIRMCLLGMNLTTALQRAG